MNRSTKTRNSWILFGMNWSAGGRERENEDEEVGGDQQEHRNKLMRASFQIFADIADF